MLELKTKKLGSCPNCKAKIISHVACPKCGYYKGKEVVDTMKRINKKTKKK
jgi:ribosomal protein L32